MTDAIAATSSSASSNSILQNYINSQKTSSTTTSGSSSSSSSATAAAAATQTALSSVTGNFNTFLNILTTQLKNQDPTSATDPNQFTQELVQFSGVEQQLNTNSKLDQLISAVNPNGITPLLNYVGQSVEATSPNDQIVVQSGSSSFGYTLPSTAANVALTVKDSTGATVATLNGPTATGLNRLTWDGQTSSGTTAPDGTYTLGVAATDSNGKAITVTDVRTIGVVTGVQTGSNGTSTLSLGGLSIADTAVDAVFSGTSSNSTAASTQSQSTSG